MHDTNGDDQARRDERKRAAQLPADRATGLRRFNLDAIEPPVGEISIRETDGSERVLLVYHITHASLREFQLRYREKMERPDDPDVDRAFTEASEAAAIDSTKGKLTRDEIGRLTSKQIGVIIGIALGEEPDIPAASPAAPPRSRKPRR